MSNNNAMAGNGNFNTSHVTVYLFHNFHTWMPMKFQYISCYCLSFEEVPIDAPPILFQYISCYCLSDAVLQRI